MKKMIVVISFAALMVGCQSARVSPSIYPVGAQVSIPIGATGSTSVTRSPGPAEQANELQKQIDGLMQSLEHPEVQGDIVLFDSTLEEIEDKQRLRDALLREADDGGALIADEETPAGRIEPRKKTVPEHLKDTFADYSDKWEGTKTTGAQGSALYSLLALGNAAKIWKIDEIAFAEDRTGDSITRSENLAQAARDLSRANADEVQISGEGNNLSFEDRNGARTLKLEVSGNDNFVTIDNDSVSNIEGAE